MSSRHDLCHESTPRARGFLVGPRVRVVVLLVLCGILGGCAGSGGRRGDPIENAKTITRNLDRGQELMRDAAEYRIDVPDENRQGLSKLLKAEELYAEARRLGPDSSGPRRALGNCRSLIGYYYYYQHLYFLNEIKGAEKAGRAPNPSLVQKSEKALADSKQWLRQANRELEYYVNYLMAKAPESRVYEQLSMNYEYLGDYAAAEDMLHRFIASTDLNSKARRELESKARALRQKRLDEFEG